MARRLFEIGRIEVGVQHHAQGSGNQVGGLGLVTNHEIVPNLHAESLRNRDPATRGKRFEETPDPADVDERVVKQRHRLAQPLGAVAAVVGLVLLRGDKRAFEAGGGREFDSLRRPGGAAREQLECHSRPGDHRCPRVERRRIHSGHRGHGTGDFDHHGSTGTCGLAKTRSVPVGFVCDHHWKPQLGQLVGEAGIALHGVDRDHAPISGQHGKDCGDMFWAVPKDDAHRGLRSTAGIGQHGIEHGAKGSEITPGDPLTFELDRRRFCVDVHHRVEMVTQVQVASDPEVRPKRVSSWASNPSLPMYRLNSAARSGGTEM